MKTPVQPIKIGLGMDLKGKTYKNCLQGFELPYIKRSHNENYAENQYTPLKKGSLFSQKLKPLIISESSKKVLSRFNLPDQLAHKIKKSSLIFKECGTHFVHPFNIEKGII